MLKRGYFRATEEALYEYRGIRKALKQREEFLESHSGEHVLVGRCTVRPISRFPEDVLVKKEHDYIYVNLSMKLQAIHDGVDYLRDLQKDLVDLYYFKGLSRIEVACELNISEREFFRQRRQAIEHIAPYIVGPFGVRED